MGTTEDTLGQWTTLRLVGPDGTETNSQILAVHAALLYDDHDNGRVLYFSGTQHDPDNRDNDATRLWASNGNMIYRLPSPGHDLFCCGHAFLEDGRLLVAGGTSDYPPITSRHDHTHYRGIRETSIFDFNAIGGSSSPWIAAQPMHEQPRERTIPRSYLHQGGGRWYPTLLTLSDGKVLAMSGHPLESDDRPFHNNIMIEIFDPLAGTRGTWIDMGDESRVPHSYPRLFLLPNGQVFCAKMYDGQSMVWDSNRNIWSNVAPFPAAERGQPYYGFDFFEMSSVLLPLMPHDSPPYRARVLVVGSHFPIIINFMDLTDPHPNWQIDQGRSAAWPNSSAPMRKHCNSVLLADGTVLITGGINHDPPNVDSQGVTDAELYSPTYLRLQTTQTNRPRSEWTRLATAHNVRGYHSVALLLPDGSVWSAGSNINGRYSFDGGTENRELSIERFLPPYFFWGRRPEIQSAPRSIVLPDIFKIITPDANNVQSVALVRCGSVTHGFNSDQRYVGLTIQEHSSTTLIVESPPNYFIAPPGYYLLFILDTQNIPSLGWFLQVGFPKQIPTIEEVLRKGFKKVDPLWNPVKYTSDKIAEDKNTKL